MEKTEFLNHVAPYFKGNVGIEHFINENESYLKSIETVDSIDDFFAFTRIYYDYSLHLINEGKIAKALIYLDSILTIINKHEKIFLFYPFFRIHINYNCSIWLYRTRNQC